MTRFRTIIRVAALADIVVLLAGCGARGAPLPPLRIVPATIAAPAATRLADRVYLEFEAPDRDSDGTTPGDIEWIEVYALTTQPTDRRPREEFSEDWLDAATLVAVLPVLPPGDDLSDAPSDSEPELADMLEDVRNRDAVTGPVAFFEVVQGAAVTVVERLTPEAQVPVTVGDPDDEDEEDDEDETDRILPMPLVSPPTPDPPIRSYVAFGISSRDRMAEPSDMVDVPLVTPPPPPGPPAVTYSAASIAVAWEEPPTFRLPVQAAEVVPPIVASTPVVGGPRPSAYVVYDVAASGDPDFRRPLRLAPSSPSASYTATAVAFGTTRCYAVRVLDYVGPQPVAPSPAESGLQVLGDASPAESGLQVLGDASPAACVVLTDTFPPAAPTGVIAVAGTDGITLIWNENSEADIAGYLVLRATPPDATLQPLTVEPLVGTTYQDTDVTAGGRYLYRVLALDTAVPPNASPPSAPITEIAR